jgi:hypothetical protein
MKVKANHPTTAEDLAEAAIKSAPRFLDENPATALLCIMGTNEIYDQTLFRQARDMIAQKLEQAKRSQLLLPV